MPLTRSVSLRARVTLLAASVVAIAVAFMAIAAYWVVARALYAEVDQQLRTRAATLIESNFEAFDFRSIALATFYSKDISVALIFPDLSVYTPPGSDVPVGTEEMDVAKGIDDSALHTVGNQRVLVERTNSGSTLVIAQRLDSTESILDRLALVLFIVGGRWRVVRRARGNGGRAHRVAPGRSAHCGGRTGGPHRRSHADPVIGNDELARFTESFNTMLRALAESRDRQSRLVADAGHELRTPLTSLRTNMELLIASSRPGAPKIPQDDMAGLRADVMAQIEELSTLVGDLVDLAREDAPETVYEPVDLGEVVERALERARRRRSESSSSPTCSPGSSTGTRPVCSARCSTSLDNAAKWGPSGDRVEVRMRQVGEGRWS